ncbi:MAG: alpha/beta hydrolase [Sandaracinus sp.]
MSSPTSRFVEANRLRHHVLEWTPEAPSDAPPILLCHGFLDVAWSFDGLARALAARGQRVLAFDWRGHGETEWVGRGGYYHFVDYVLDLSELTAALGLSASGYDLVGHSMGGTACAMFAATRPPGLRTLALLEGTGPPATDGETLPERIELWLETVAKTRDKSPRPLRDLDDAIARLRLMHPDLEGELARFVADKHTVVRDGARYFAFDPLHRTRAPIPFRVEAFRAQLARIAVPTLVVSGEKGWRPPDQAERVACLAHHEEVEIAGVGHMLHWHAPDTLADRLADFGRRTSPVFLTPA